MHRTLRGTFGLAILLLGLWSLSAFGTTVRMQTSLGDIHVQLMDDAAPATVANFLNYVVGGAYDNSFIHRSVPGFVVQGGGYRWNIASSDVSVIPANAPVVNEFSASRSNLRGTIAMAKLGGDPNSATNQWFFNLGDNSANLDSQNGGFTVFGKVAGNGMQVIDAIAALQIVNANGGNPSGPFDSLPLISVPSGAITMQNLVIVSAVTVLDLTAIAITGPASLASLAAGTYEVIASYSDGSTFKVNGALTLAGTPCATLSGNTLTALNVSADQSVTLNASYTERGVSRSASLTVSIRAAPDTQAPTVPAGLTASAMNSTQINLSWSPATDNVGISAYQVFRDGVFRTTIDAPAARFSDSGLTASTVYSYTVAACDAAANCSPQSPSASATTLGPGMVNLTPGFVSGFSQTGNSLTTPIDVLTVFGSANAPVADVSNKVEAVWAWNATTKKWKFHTPQFTAADSAGYALANDYEVLASLPPGAGYWISATAPVNLPAQAGMSFDYDQAAFSALPNSFNLLSTGSTLTPSQFNASVGVDPINFNALWAWDAARSKWYFYSPLLEQPGAPFTNAQYGVANGFQDFSGGTPPAPAFSLQPGAGFWVEIQ